MSKTVPKKETKIYTVESRLIYKIEASSPLEAVKKILDNEVDPVEDKLYVEF